MSVRYPDPETSYQVPLAPFPPGTQENITGLPGAMTTHYWTRRIRTLESGTMICPTAGTGTTPAEFVTLHSPYEIECVYWFAAKEGKPPTVPAPGLFDGNHIFLKGWVAADAPMLLPSEVGHVWVMAGMYCYGMITANPLDSAFPTAVMPFDPTPIDQTTIPAANFSSAILNGGIPPQTLQNLLIGIKGPGG